MSERTKALRRGASKGGKRRAKNLSPEELRAIARKGGLARAKNLTPEQRSEIARKAVQIGFRRARHTD